MPPSLSPYPRVAIGRLYRHAYRSTCCRDSLAVPGETPGQPLTACSQSPFCFRSALASNLSSLRRYSDIWASSSSLCSFTALPPPAAPSRCLLLQPVLTPASACASRRVPRLPGYPRFPLPRRILSLSSVPEETPETWRLRPRLLKKRGVADVPQRPTPSDHLAMVSPATSSASEPFAASLWPSSSSQLRWHWHPDRAFGWAGRGVRGLHPCFACLGPYLRSWTAPPHGGVAFSPQAPLPMAIWYILFCQGWLQKAFPAPSPGVVVSHRP